MPNGFVESFVDTVFTEGVVVFGGAFAPTLHVSLSGDRTNIVSELKYGFIP